MSDHIELSKDSAEFFEWRASQTHALIAIAEELRRMNVNSVVEQSIGPLINIGTRPHDPHVDGRVPFTQEGR